jgi:DNA adenine methylase
MQYMGSKNRIAKDILKIILANRDNDTQVFYDVFCGGGSICGNVGGKVIAVDCNEYVIEALKLIRDNPGSLPRNNREFTEDMYKKVDPDNKGYYGYVGYALSYGGKWYGGWQRNSNNFDYVKCAFNSSVCQSKKIQNVSFIHQDYNKIDFEPKSIIYCDPPYTNTTGYNKNKFDSKKFWGWCLEKYREGHKIFVSEYTAPNTFKCIWKKQVLNQLKENNSEKVFEKLWIPKDMSIKFTSFGF